MSNKKKKRTRKYKQKFFTIDKNLTTSVLMEFSVDSMVTENGYVSYNNVFCKSLDSSLKIEMCQRAIKSKSINFSRQDLSEYFGEVLLFVGFVQSVRKYSNGFKLLVANPLVLGRYDSPMEDYRSNRKFEKEDISFFENPYLTDTHIWLDLDDVSIEFLKNEGTESFSFISGVSLIFTSKVVRYVGKTEENKKGYKYGVSNTRIIDQALTEGDGSNVLSLEGQYSDIYDSIDGFFSDITVASPVGYDLFGKIPNDMLLLTLSFTEGVLKSKINHTNSTYYALYDRCKGVDSISVESFTKPSKFLFILYSTYGVVFEKYLNPLFIANIIRYREDYGLIYDSYVYRKNNLDRVRLLKSILMPCYSVSKLSEYIEKLLNNDVDRSIKHVL